MKKDFNLEKRLINFSGDILDLSDLLPDNIKGKYLADQITRSGISPSLNYGEAQNAESRKDFIHKMKIVQKELRETMVSLKIIIIKKIITDSEKPEKCLDECQQLLAIISASINTAKRNLK